jgi:hypothetical protein
MASIHDLFPIGPRSVDQEPGFDPLSPAPASCPPIDLERAARATRDAGMQQALRPLVTGIRPVREPKLWTGDEMLIVAWGSFMVGCLVTVLAAFLWGAAL